MYYPLLEKIDEYIATKGLPRSEVYISIKRLPQYLKNAVTEEVTKLGNTHVLDDTCIISYDNNGVISLIFTFDEGKVNLLVNDTKEELDFPNPNFRFTRIRSNVLFDKAVRLEWLNNKLVSISSNVIKKKLDKYREAYNRAKEEDKNKIEKEIKCIAKKYHDFSREELLLLIDTDDVVIDYNKNSTLNEELKVFENTVKQYIDYLNIAYIKDREAAKEQKINGNNIVYYTPEDGDTVSKRSSEPTLNSKNLYNERKNSIIPADFRDQVVEQLSPIRVKIASAINVENLDVNNEIDLSLLYTCSLIQFDKNQYMLIMEPYNGTKYTRVAYFNYEGEINNEVLDHVIRKYVSLNEKNCSQNKSVVRLNHTSKETYANALWYATTRDLRTKINPYTKTNIDQVVFEEIELEKSRSL